MKAKRTKLIETRTKGEENLVQNRRRTKRKTQTVTVNTKIIEIQISSQFVQANNRQCGCSSAVR